MPTGYPTNPETAPPSSTHGWPVPDVSDGWTTTLYREDEPRGSYSAVRWSKAGIDMTGDTQILGSALGKYDPGRLLGYLRALHRYLLLLDALQYRWGKPARAFNSYDYPLGNFADQWTLRCTGQSGTTLTIQNVYSGCDDPRRLPVTGASGTGTTYSRLQPWDVIKSPGASYGPYGIVTDVSYGDTSTTVTVHKAPAIDSTPVNIGAEGDRCEPPLCDYPEPYTVSGRCANCRLDPTGALASGHASGLYTAGDPEYYGAPATTYLGTYWYCAAMDTADLVSGFTPGTCAQTGCSGYSEASQWTPMPVGAWGRIWMASNVALVWDALLASPRYLAQRIGMPSLRSLCGATKTLDELGEFYDKQGAVSYKSVLWDGPPLWGTLSGSDHTWISGIFREDGTGILDGAAARASFAGGTTASETDADTGTDRYKSMDCHPARRLPSVALNDYEATPGSPSEYFVGRRRKRTRGLTDLTQANVGEVSHYRATTQFHGSPGKSVTASFTSGLTISLERDRTATKTTISERARMVYSAAVEDGCLKVQFYPEVVSLGYVTLAGTPPTPADATKNVLAAGGTVDAPFWSRCINTSAGSNRCKIGCVYDKVQVGDVLTFDSDDTYSFTVVRAEAHYGSKFSGTVDGVSSSEEPTGGIYATLSEDISDSATTINVLECTRFPASGQIQIDSEEITYTGRTATAFTGCTRGANGTTPAAHSEGDAVAEDSGEPDSLLMGVPSDWAPGASSTRLKMDTVWLDWTGELGATVLTAASLPAQGDVVTVSTGPVLAPQRYAGASGAIGSTGFDAFPVVKRYSGGTPTTLAAGTDYLVDRATGIIEVAYSVVSAWPTAVGDVTVEGWFLEAPIDLQAELLTETRDALRRIDGAMVSAQVEECALLANYDGGAFLPEWDLTGNDPETGTVTIVESVGSSKVLYVGFTSIQLMQSAGTPGYPRALIKSPGWSLPGFKVSVFAPIHGLKPDWISAAYMDVYLDGQIYEIPTTTTLAGGTVTGTQREANVAGHLLVTDATGAIVYSSGGSTGVSATTGWQKVNVTDAVKTLATSSITATRTMYLVLSGQFDGDLSAGDNTGLSGLFSPVVDSVSFTESNGTFTAFSASYSYIWSDGATITFAARNLRLSLDWDAIEADDLPDFPYDNWPAHTP